MKGIHKVVISTKYLKYEFELRRNLTIIRGDSATGKTTLVDMIRTHMNDGESGPVTLNCDKGCYVVEGNLWKGQLDNIQDSIVFIDEGNEFVKTKDFAGAIQQTDNYYVIVTREGLPALPYSVEEVYGIRTSGKYGALKQSYHSFYRIYPDSTTENIKPEKILTEDSNSGYQFFDAVCAEHQMQCDTANGKSNVFSYLKAHRNEKILVIADGAAFGPEMDRVLQLVQTRENLALYLPESFEWLVYYHGEKSDGYTHFDGHTEIYATYTHTKKYTMMLAHHDLRVVHVSTHVSLREACDRVKKERVLEVIEIANKACKDMGIENPRIAVAGLNPHCGENGLFGREEIEEITPAIEAAKAEGITGVVGPCPPDSVFSQAIGGWYDIVVCMYHDQGHIPLKTVGFVYDREKQEWKAVEGVNVTLGLPIIRASVDHGTDFYHAGKGNGNELSLVNAIKYAVKMTGREA